MYYGEGPSITSKFQNKVLTEPYKLPARFA
jgi:hypothetical protein